MQVLMEYPAEPVTASYVKAGDLARAHEWHGQWLEWAGVGDARMRPVPVVEEPNSRRACRRWGWFQISVRSRNSRRQICTYRSIIEFILGIRTPLRATSMPASARMASNTAGNFPPGP